MYLVLFPAASPGFGRYTNTPLSPETTALPVAASSPVAVKRNNKGGVLVTPEDITNAFSMLDIEKTGTLTLATMKKRLSILFPDMTAKEYRFLMNNKKGNLRNINLILT